MLYSLYYKLIFSRSQQYFYVIYQVLKRMYNEFLLYYADSYFKQADIVIE